MNVELRTHGAIMGNSEKVTAMLEEKVNDMNQ